MKRQLLVVILLLQILPFIYGELNQVDKCLSKMKKLLNGQNNGTKTLGGMVGVGWDDLQNEYTLPIFKETFHKCLTDLDNHFLVPDNIILIPIKKTDLDRTSSTFSSYDEFMESNSNKLTITGSVAAKKGSASASFSKEHAETKKEFVKQNSFMLQNKLVYEAYQLIANDNGEYEEAFLRRINEIAEAVKEKNDLKVQFLAETFIGDYGTHVVNKATAAAQIEQQYFIEKTEKFKGKTHMDKIAVGASGEFENASAGGSGSVSYENSKSDSENETETSSSMKSIIKVKGGPHVNRIGSTDPKNSMLYVDNLVGIKQSGKFIYDIIPALKLPKHSEYAKFRVKKAIFDATQNYYKFNYLPGCTDLESENYNFLANDDDGSCQDPKELFNFGGVFQRCSPIQSYASRFEDIPFGDQCKQFEQSNLVTGELTCPEGMEERKINSFKLEFTNRIIPFERRRCYGPSFLQYCRYEMVNENVYDAIFVQAYWCTNVTDIEPEEKVEREINDLDKIMRNDILTTIDKFPRILELFFNESFSVQKKMGEEDTVCKNMPEDKNNNRTSVQEYEYQFMGKISTCYFDCDLKKLKLEADQLETLFIYPKVIEALLPIVELPSHVSSMQDLFRSASENPIVLKQILFNEKKSIHFMDSEMKFAFFGGAFRETNLNPFTGRSTCPPNFSKVTILRDLNICVSDDSNLSWPIRLGGFHHCHSKIQMCPRGYSQYLGTIHEGCEHYYCIRFATRHTFPPPIVNKPPYISYEDALS